MKASIAGRVRNTTLPKTKALLPLFETVMNSFQAIEEAGAANHSIQIVAERQKTIDNTGSGAFDGFQVIDTGIGFTDTNFDSFQTVDSPYKATQDGKGLGRFLWLKAFHRVEIDSHYAAIGHKALRRRKFQFKIVDEDQPASPVQSARTAAQTTVHLIGLMQPYIDEVPCKLEDLAQRLIAHFLPLFLNPHGPSLHLVDEAQSIDLRAVFRTNFLALASERRFEVGTHAFTLSGFRLRGTLADHHEIIYAAHFREVVGERLAKFLPNLKGKLHDEEKGDFYYLAFVQGDLLNERVNNERTDFAIAREASATDQPEAAANAVSTTPQLIPDEVSLRNIRNMAITAISEDLQPYIAEINQQKEDALTAFVEQDQPQYRALLKYKGEFIDQIPPQASKAELDMALHKQIYQRQVKLKAEGQKILSETEYVANGDEYYARFKKFVEDSNELGKTALAQYVVHRRVILELLQKAIRRDPGTGEYGLEKTIHQLIFPMRATSDDVPIEQQNLWIIDERLMFHTFLASDKPMSQLEPLATDSDSRPDLLIFDRPLVFSEDGALLQAMVVVEFKKPDRSNYRDEDPVTQVYRMVREIRNGERKDKSGRFIRPSSNQIPAYCYIICDLTPSVETRIQNMGARRTPDNLGYYGFNETLNAYYEVISYTKLLDDAKKRNRILFDKLNVPPME